MKAHGIPTCSDNLEFVKASSVTARDTAWFLDRMARVNDRSSPDVEVELLRAQAQGQGSVHKDVVQETHQAIAQVFFSSVGLSVCLWTYVVTFRLYLVVKKCFFQQPHLRQMFTGQ